MDNRFFGKPILNSPYDYPLVNANNDANPELKRLPLKIVRRGKDEPDWSDLVVQAPPLYIRQKVHLKVLIDDFNGLPDAATRERDHLFVTRET